MAEEFRVSLGVALNETQLGSVRTTLSNLTSGTHRVRIDLDTRRVQQQINSIRNQIQNLGRIRIDLGGNNNNGGGGRGNNGLRHTIDDANRAYNELMSLQRRISSASKSIEILDADANERQIMSLSSQLDILLERYNALMSAFENDLSYNQLDNLRRSSEITDEKIEELQSRVVDLRRNLAEGISTRLFTGDFQNQLNALQDSYNQIGVSNQTVVRSIENVRLALADMNTANASGNIELLIDAQQRYVIALETADNALKDFKRTQNSANRDVKLVQDVELFRQKIQIWSKDNSFAAKEFAARLDDIQNRLNNCNRTELDGLKREFKQLQNEAELANTGFKKYYNDLVNKFGKYGVYLSASQMIMYSVQSIKEGITTVKELDTALVDLQKTAKASGAELEKFYFNANEIAKEYGSTTQEIIQSAADWSRTGFNLKDSQLMAQYSSMFRSISPDLDIDTATNGLVSIMKAYGIEAENVLDGVLSKINAVGNTAATSNGEIVQGLQNSAAAMAVMGTTLDETIALFTAGQEISQDAAKVGNALRTISMRIRGYDEETEELSEDLANITGEVIDLTKVASRPEGISLFTDETQTEYKSMYVYLQEISQIFDELGAKQQQELLEKLFGKNRAAIGAAIIQNFKAAENAMNTMAHSAGNAEVEMSVIMDSMEYKLNRLKETGTGIAQNLFQRDDMKLVLDSLTSILEIVDKLTESLGLFGTIGAGIVLFNVVKSGYISTTISLLNEAGWSFTNLGDAAKTAGKDLLAFAKTPAGIASAIGLVTAAISIGISIYKKAKQEFRDGQQEIYNTAEAALESVDAFEESFLAISEFSKKSELTKQEQEQLSSAINTTNGILGDNAIAFDSASGSAKDYLETLQEISKEEIKNQRIEATKKRQAAEELLKDSTWDDFTGSQIGFETHRTKTSSIEIFGQTLYESIQNSWDNNPELLSAKNIVEELMSDYINSFTTGSSNTAGKWSLKKFNLQPIDWDVNKDNMDAVADYYYRLDELTNRLSEAQLTNNDIYSKASTEISNLKTDVEAYTQSKYEELKLLYEEKNGIPTTAGGFIALNDYIMEAAGSYGALRKEFQTFLYEDFGSYFNQDLINKISDIRDKFTSSSKYKNGTLNYQKNESEKFNAWIETLSGREIEILYKISLDEASVDYTFEEWQNAFNNYEIPDEMKLSFSDLMKDETFRTTIDDYIERVGVLQEALTKIQSDEWDGASDFTSLIDTFPELTDDANNLENAIVDLLGSMNAEKLVEFNSQFENLKTEEDQAALEAFMNSVLKLGRVVGDTSFSINISTETEKMSNLVNAISESVSSTGLSSESIKNIENMFSGLEGYDPSKLFENTEHGIHLNVQALRALQSQYEAVTKVNIKEHLQDLKQEYNTTKNELEGLTEGTIEWYKASAELEHIKNQIDEVQQLAAQYEGLTSAYNQWLMAQSTENENDAFLKVSNGIEGIKELFKEGWVGTDDFREAVQLMTDTDLSTASVEDILAVYEKGMPTMEKFFTGGTDGLLNFLNTAKDVSDKLGKQWVVLGEDGNWHIDFGIGGDAEIAKAISDMTGLQISTEQVQILLKALSAAGFDVNLDSAYTSIEELQARVEETESVLKGMEKVPVDIDINAEDIDAEIEYAKNKIEEINNSDISPNVKTALLDDANAKLDLLISRKNEANQQTVSVDADTSEAENKISELDIKEIAIDVDVNGQESVDTLKDSIDDLEDKIVTVTVVTKNVSTSTSSSASTMSGNNTKQNNRFSNIAIANGTAFSNGSIGRAFKREDWSIKDSGVALGGELGQELVVRDGHYFTIGDNSAEFFQYKKGDIIFNAEQTKQLFTNGRISNGSKRGNAFVHGNVTGRAFSNADGQIIVSGDVITSSNGNSGNSSGNSADEFKETFDWIETAIDRIERAIESLDKKSSSTYKSWGNRNKALNEQIAETRKEIDLQQRGYERYLEQANSVGLSEDWATKVRNGEIDIEDITDETLAEQIKEYQEWYEKALDCKDAIDELRESVASLYEEGFNNIVSEYNNQLSLIEHLSNTYQNSIDTLEARGYLGSAQYYSALQDAEQQNLIALNAELNALTQSFSETMASGEIEEGSEAWYSMQNEINAVKEQIDEANLSLIEYGNTMREIEWGYFDFIQERISQLTQESDFLIDLMSNSDLYSDKGQLTDTGMATMGLHGMNYNTYMAQADQYAAEMLEIEKQLAEDPYNTQLIERKEELLGLQQESILAAEAEKQAIVDMVREGIELELEAMKELIDTYTNALDSAKDLYDYQKKIQNQTSEISNIRKQLLAYENDLSEETKAKVQKLQVELKEAEENLEETEYERYISEQKKLLDELYTEYETVLNQRLDNIDALIESTIATINENADLINSTLTEVAGDVGYTMTENMQSVWNGSINSLDGTLSIYGDSFNEKLTSINDVLNQIQANISAMIGNSDEQASEDINNTTSVTEPDVNVTTPSTPQETQPESSTSQPTVPEEKKITVGGKINAKGAKIYGYVGDTSGENQYFANDPIYTVLDESNGYLKVRWHKLSSGTTGWFKRNDVKAYKTGGLVDYTGLAWVDGQKSKPESFLDAQDTKNFIALKETLSKMTEQGIPFNSMYGLTQLPDFNGLLDVANMPISGTPNGVSVGDIIITIPIEHVDDYNDFVSQLQKDKQFERFIQSMTIDRLVGRTSLTKNKFQFGNR